MPRSFLNTRVLLACVVAVTAGTPSLGEPPGEGMGVRSVDASVADLAAVMDVELWKYTYAQGTGLDVRLKLELWRRGKRESDLAMTSWLINAPSAPTAHVALRHPDKSLTEADELLVVMRLGVDGSETSERKSIKNPLKGYGVPGVIHERHADQRQVALLVARQDGTVSADVAKSDVALVLAVETRRTTK
jgi:hypothetical protein